MSEKIARHKRVENSRKMTYATYAHVQDLKYMHFYLSILALNVKWRQGAVSWKQGCTEHTTSVIFYSAEMSDESNRCVEVLRYDYIHYIW